MKKTLRLVVALAMVLCMVVPLAGCGKSFDAAGYVRGALDAFRTGTVSDELADMSYESKEELQQEVDDQYADLVKQIVGALDEKYITDDMKVDLETYAKAACGAMKYEVSDECTEEDGVYTVNITVYPMLTFDTWNEYVQGELTNKWIEKVRGYNSEEKFYQDFYAEVIKEMAEYFSNEENVTYGDPEEMTIKVSKAEGSEYYEANESDVEKAVLGMFGQ